MDCSRSWSSDEEFILSDIEDEDLDSETKDPDTKDPEHEDPEDNGKRVPAEHAQIAEEAEAEEIGPRPSNTISK